MMRQSKKNKGIAKKIIIGAVALLLIGLAAAWYIFNQKFEDTTTATAAYTVSALPFINEFKTGDSLNKAANTKYSDKIITVNGKVTEVEAADSTVNLKITNDDGAYI